MKVTLILMCFFSSFALLHAQKTPEPHPNSTRLVETFYPIKNSHSINLGIGIPNLANTAFNISKWIGYDTQGKASPNFTLKYEYALNSKLGIGAHVGYYTAKTPAIVTSLLSGDIIGVIGGVGCELGLTIPGLTCDTLYSTEDREPAFDRIHATTVGARFAYHQNQFLGIKKLDAYAVALLGYSFIKTKRIGSQKQRIEKSRVPRFIYNTNAGVRYYLSPQIGLYGEFGYGSLSIINLGLTYRILPKKV